MAKMVEILTRDDELKTVQESELSRHMALGARILEAADRAAYANNGESRDPGVLEHPGLPEKVEVIDAQGRVGTIPRGAIDAALSQGGFKLRNPRDEQELKDQREFGEGAGSAVTALAAGFARGIFPGSELALTGIPGISKRSLREIKRRRELLSGIGEVGGFVTTGPKGLVQGAAKGGFKLFGKVAPAALTKSAQFMNTRALTNAAAMGVGKGVDKLISHALPAGAQATAKKYAIPLAKQLTEGAVAGAATFADEAALGEPNLSGQQLLSHIGTGAVLSGALAAPFIIGKAAKEPMSRLLQRASDKTKIHLTDEFIQGMADELAYTGAVSGGKATTAQKREMGAFLRKHGIVNDKNDTVGRVTRKVINLNDKARAAFNEVNDTLDGFYGDSYATGNNLFVTSNEIAGNLEEFIKGNQLRGRPRNILRTEISRLKELGDVPLTFKDANARKTAIQEEIKAFQREVRRPFTPDEKKLFIAADRLNDLIETKVNKFTEFVPGTKAMFKDSSYKDMRRLVADSFNARKAIEGAKGSSGLGKLFEAANFGASGAIFSQMTGDFVTGFGAAKAFKWASKVMKGRGPFYGVAAANKIHEMGGIAVALNKTQETTTKAVKQFFEAGNVLKQAAVIQLTPTIAHNKSDFAKVAAAVQGASGDPTAFDDMLDEQLFQFEQVAPKMSNAMRMTMHRAMGHLAATLPRPPAQDLASVAAKREWQPSETAVSSYFRRLRAINNPSTVIQDLASGKLSREGVEVLKSVYPEMYAATQMEIMNQMADSKEAIPYQKRILLTSLFGVAVDSAMRPDTLASLQGIYRPAEEQQGGPPRTQFAPSRAGKLKLGESSMTESQRLEKE